MPDMSLGDTLCRGSQLLTSYSVSLGIFVLVNVWCICSLPILLWMHPCTQPRQCAGNEATVLWLRPNDQRDENNQRALIYKTAQLGLFDITSNIPGLGCMRTCTCFIETRIFPYRLTYLRSSAMGSGRFPISERCTYTYACRHRSIPCADLSSRLDLSFELASHRSSLLEQVTPCVM